MSWLNKPTLITQDLIEFINDVNLLELSYDETVHFLREFLAENHYRDIRSRIIKERIRQNFTIRAFFALLRYVSMSFLYLSNSKIEHKLVYQ